MRKPRGAVRHHALALRAADRGAEVGLARQARRALPALRRVERDDVVALLHRGHARPDVDHDARALVAEDRRKQSFRVLAGQRELVGVADAGRLDLDQHLARLRAFELHMGDRERLARLECHRRTHVHAAQAPGFVIINCVCVTIAASLPSPRVMRVCHTVVVRPRCSGVHSAFATSPTGIGGEEIGLALDRRGRAAGLRQVGGGGGAAEIVGEAPSARRRASRRCGS